MNRERRVSLHSRYNPGAEAERYVASLPLNGNIRFFILIEPGLGYIADPLKKRFPAAKIIALHAGNLHEPLSEQAGAGESNRKITPLDAEWYPGTGISAQDFLENEIPDSAAAEIRLVEWRPALAVYGAAYVSLVGEAAAFIKRADANARTLKAFGRNWFGNFFTNLEIIRETIRPVPLSLPVLVTGAGPGLEEVLPFIREEARRGGLFILAVSSSAAALETWGVLPDMMISTDGGGWAKFHLYETFRNGYVTGGNKVPLAAAMSAALPSQCGTIPVLPVSDGSVWQKLILSDLGIPFLALPQRGTVSAAALDLAFALTSGEIYIAGLDLANMDIRSHVRPYSFDRLLEEKAARFNPVYSQAYKRSSLLKAGGSYGIYASWFEKQLSAYPKRLHSIGKNNILFGSAETAFSQKAQSPENTGSRIHFSGFPLRSGVNIREEALNILEKALKNDEYSAALCGELSSLLLPGAQNGASIKNRVLDAVYSSVRAGKET